VRDAATPFRAMPMPRPMAIPKTEHGTGRTRTTALGNFLVDVEIAGYDYFAAVAGEHSFNSWSGDEAWGRSAGR